MSLSSLLGKLHIALADMIEKDLGGIQYQAIFFLEDYSAPVGLTWSTTMTFRAFQQSIAVLGRPFAPILLIIQTLTSQLLPWFGAVNHEATKFSIPWQDLAAVAFQNHIMVSLPVTIIDTPAPSPLQDMHYGQGWRLNCDRVLSPGQAVDRR
jgi:hypothetical protein